MIARWIALELAAAIVDALRLSRPPKTIAEMQVEINEAYSRLYDLPLVAGGDQWNNARPLPPEIFERSFVPWTWPEAVKRGLDA